MDSVPIQVSAVTPTLGAERLGAAPSSPEEVQKVCEMARKYEGHRAEVGLRVCEGSILLWMQWCLVQGNHEIF